MKLLQVDIVELGSGVGALGSREGGGEGRVLFMKGCSLTDCQGAAGGPSWEVRWVHLRGGGSNHAPVEGVRAMIRKRWVPGGCCR